MGESIARDFEAMAYALGLQDELKPLGQIVAPQHATRRTGAAGPGGTTVAPGPPAVLMPRPELPTALSAASYTPQAGWSGLLDLPYTGGVGEFNAPTRPKVAGA